MRFWRLENFRQFRVGGIVAIDGVEAEHAQVSGQHAEVGIEDKARGVRWQCGSQERRQAERVKHGIDGDPVAVAHLVSE